MVNHILIFCCHFSQTVTQLLSAAMIIYAITGVQQTSASAVLLQPWFVLLVFATAMERLSGLAFGVMVERDWVVLVIYCLILSILRTVVSFLFSLTSYFSFFTS